LTADLFWTGLLVSLPVLGLTMLAGLVMMPPTTVALPLKVLMFVLVDGWSLILKALVGSFH
jgi:flagellar biosynthetic protein FliP